MRHGIFESQAKITQYFGVNYQYYSQFGNAGHEGIDLIPTGENWTIFSFFDGTVMDVYESASYGICAIIYAVATSFSYRFAHLSEVFVHASQFIEVGSSIGVMGETGNTNGAHLHLNCVPMVSYGAKKHPDNGYKGRVDPLPMLEVYHALEGFSPLQ